MVIQPWKMVTSPTNLGMLSNYESTLENGDLTAANF